MSFFTELKQRNVFKVAIAYTVVGWLLIQVAEVVAPQMNLPEWTPRMITFVVMLGFPVSLVMAWALELTPEGVKKAEGKNMPVYVIAAALLALSVFWFLGKEESTTATETATAAPISVNNEPAKSPEIPSVAVLPFVNMSSDAENEYFSDGMTEELLNLLVRIEGLRVPSRTSSFAFKGQNTDIRNIAEQLQVEHILEGSVRKSGSSVRITAQLIDVATDTHLWSETYDRQLEDVFAIQDEIAGHIVEALQLTLAPTRPVSEPTRNMEAYNLYLQGRFLIEQRGISLQEAENLLLQAIDLDPGFGEAYASLAMTYTLFPSYLGMPRQEPHAKAVQMAERALAIDPGLVEASMSIAQVRTAARQWKGSLDRYEMITMQNPRHALAQLWYGISLMEAGYLSRALEAVNISVGLDPVSGLALDWQARLLIMNGRAAEATSIAQRAVHLGRAQGRVPLAHYLIETGDSAALKSTLVDNPQGFESVFARFIEIVENPASYQDAVHWTREASIFSEKQPSLAAYALMIFAVAVGDPQDIYQQFSRVVLFDHNVIADSWWPSLNNFRSSEYFEPWVTEHGLLELWQTNGWPDLCRPIEEDGFECD